MVFMCYICSNVEYHTKLWISCEEYLGCEYVETDDKDFEYKSDSSESSSDSNSVDSDRAASGKNNHELKVQAAECWVLLSTVMSPETILQHARERGVFHRLVQLVYDAKSDPEQKATAGRALAYLWEVAEEYYSRNELEEIDIEEENIAFSSSSRNDVRRRTMSISENGHQENLGKYICNDEEEITEFFNNLKEMSKGSLKNISKKTRKEQRSEFRDIEDKIIKGENPFTNKANASIRMQGTEIIIDSFAKLNIINRLKSVLVSGFHSSLNAYPVLRDLLELNDLNCDNDAVDTSRKVYKGSALGKSRDIGRKQERREKECFMEDVGGY